MTRSVVCSVFRCGVHGVNVAYSSFLGSCERERSGCCFGFRDSYSGILPDKFRILHKFAALAGSFFDKFVRFSLFTDPSWGQIVSSHPTISCFRYFCILGCFPPVALGAIGGSIPGCGVHCFPGHHPRAWLWSVVGGTIHCKAVSCGARFSGRGSNIWS